MENAAYIRIEKISKKETKTSVHGDSETLTAMLIGAMVQNPELITLFKKSVDNAEIYISMQLIKGLLKKE